MRNLTIRRNKTFVGCLGKMKVYIEDRETSETSIGGVPCRKLGTLKNGEEKTFEVTEEGARIYVIADKLSKNYCNEFYDLAPGTEDVFLSGQNRYNPVTGNPFRFDGVASEASKQNRNKGLVIGAIVLCVAFLVGIAIGVGGVLIETFASRSDPQFFTEGEMTIELTQEFLEMDEFDEYDAVYATYDVLVMVLREPLSDFAGTSVTTVTDYAEAIIQTNALKSSSVYEKDGLIYIPYTATSSGETYRYCAFVYKTENAFWMIQFATLSEDFEDYESRIFEWADSVSFSKSFIPAT